MATDSNRDSELAEAERQVRVANAELLTSLADVLTAARTASARATKKQLAAWQEHSQKLWLAQRCVAERHGLSFEAELQTRTLIRDQLKRSWLGNLVGLVLPVCLFGFGIFEHGLLLPVFWLSAITADVAGRVTCIKLSYVSDEFVDRFFQREPAELSRLVEKALDEDRVSGDWTHSIDAMTDLADLDADIVRGDQALRQARRTGIIAASGSLIALSLTLMAAQRSLIPSAILPWAALVVALVLVYGLAVWITSFSYADAVEQPPYPSRGSADELKTNIGLEISLKTSGAELLRDAESIRKSLPSKMLLGSEMHNQLRRLEQRETAVNDADWQLKIVKTDLESLMAN